METYSFFTSNAVQTCPFTFTDLIGLPFRVVVSEKTLKEDSVEVKARAKEEIKLIRIEKLAGFLNGSHG